MTDNRAIVLELEARKLDKKVTLLPPSLRETLLFGNREDSVSDAGSGSNRMKEAALTY